MNLRCQGRGRIGTLSSPRFGMTHDVRQASWPRAPKFSCALSVLQSPPSLEEKCRMDRLAALLLRTCLKALDAPNQFGEFPIAIARRGVQRSSRSGGGMWLCGVL